MPTVSSDTPTILELPLSLQSIGFIFGRYPIGIAFQTGFLNVVETMSGALCDSENEFFS